MKNLSFLFVSLFITTCLSHAQTELWYLQRRVHDIALLDGAGNTYLARGDNLNNAPDSLEKISPTGETIWKAPIPLEAKYYELLSSDRGVYVAPPRFETPIAVYHYSTDGILQWVHSLPDGATMRDFARVDQGGNIILTYTSGDIHYPPIVSKLVKLKSNGELVFEVTIPSIATNAREESILGPAIASNGEIWVLARATTEVQRQQGSRSVYKVIGYEDAMRFDGATGALLQRKNIFQGITQESVDDGRGNTKDFTFNNGSNTGNTQFVTSSGNNFIAGGYSDTELDRCRSNGTCNTVQKSEWRMSVIDQTGNVKQFRYRGKGDFRGSTSRGSYRGDNSGNELKEIFVGADGILYLHGTIAKGKTMNEVGNWHIDDVLMRFNLGRKKIEWKIVTTNPVDPTNAYRRTYFYEPAQLLFRQRDSKTIDVYDGVGSMSATPLVFTDNVGLPPNGFRSIHNTESGALILKGEDSAGYFIGKYSIADQLAGQHFTKQPDLYDVDHPSQFALFQNYPNPFNPTTTIEFELADDAIVTATVYNTLGQEVAELIQGELLSAGIQQVEFDGSDLPSGVYYYRIAAADAETGQVQFSHIKKMLMIK